MKNIDFIVKSVSKELQLPEEDIKDLLKIYWKEVLDNITSFEKEAIYIRNIGTLHINYFLMRQQVKKAIQDLRVSKTPERTEKIKTYLRKVLKMRAQVSSTNWKYNGRFSIKKQKKNIGRNQESDKT